jgi:uncharacterized membrane protein
MVNARRIARHLFMPEWAVGRAFPTASLAEVEAAIRESERRHSGEIRFAVEAALGMLGLLRGETARQRAIEVFSELCVWDTEANNGVLIYLLLADRDVEIVADRGLNGLVAAEEWEAICREMELDFRQGRFREGVLAGIAAVSGLLTRHFPPTGISFDELPDRPARLS